MSFLVYFLILHLCVSMHACSSRHLGVFHKEPRKDHDQSPLKTTEKPELVFHELQGIKDSTEDNTQQRDIKLEFPLNHEHKGLSDIKVEIISQEENKVVEWKNHGRSTMESKLQDSNETINKSKDNNSVTEDVVVMDYAQPHRKPPIHNIQP